MCRTLPNVKFSRFSPPLVTKHTLHCPRCLESECFLPASGHNVGPRKATTTYHCPGLDTSPLGALVAGLDKRAQCALWFRALIYMPRMMLIQSSDWSAVGTQTFSAIQHVLQRACGCPSYCYTRCSLPIFHISRVCTASGLTSTWTLLRTARPPRQALFRTSISHFCSLVEATGTV